MADETVRMRCADEKGWPERDFHVLDYGELGRDYCCTKCGWHQTSFANGCAELCVSATWHDLDAWVEFRAAALEGDNPIPQFPPQIVEPDEDGPRPHTKGLNTDEVVQALTTAHFNLIQKRDEAQGFADDNLARAQRALGEGRAFDAMNEDVGRQVWAARAEAHGYGRASLEVIARVLKLELDEITA